MAKPKEHQQALLLRKRGFSIGEIAKKTQVSKGTVSAWCRNIVLSQNQIEEIGRRSKHHATAALLKSAEKRRQERIRVDQLIYKTVIQKIGTVTERDVFMVGLGLYWGEGYKKGNQEFGFTNSDPSMIKFYINWLATIFDISKTDLILRVSINIAHKNRIHTITTHWSKITGVPQCQFTKPSFIKTKTKKIYANATTHFGTLRVKVRRGTRNRKEVIKAIQFLGSYA